MKETYDKLLFGSAGIPVSTENRSTENGIRRVKELGLGAMELEFVRSVNITEDRAPEVKKVAQDNNVVLTCHGQYYINLNSDKKSTIKASVERILTAARIADLCGAGSLTFHSAYYMKRKPEKVYKQVKKKLEEITETLQDEGNKIHIRPETTGKTSQFGDLEEVINLSSELDQVHPCIDFAHFHARTNGDYNSLEEFSSILEKVENKLGKKELKNMHIHISGIDYGEKGEKKHLNLKESDFRFRELAQALKDFDIKGVVISESPNLEGDAQLLKETYDSL